MHNRLSNITTELLEQIISYSTFEDFVSLREAQADDFGPLYSEEICSQFVEVDYARTLLLSIVELTCV